eukprot:984939_1
MKSLLKGNYCSVLVGVLLLCSLVRCSQKYHPKQGKVNTDTSAELVKKIFVRKSKGGDNEYVNLRFMSDLGKKGDDLDVVAFLPEPPFRFNVNIKQRKNEKEVKPQERVKLKECSFCERPLENPKMCEGCKKVGYCGKRCQKLHWVFKELGNKTRATGEEHRANCSAQESKDSNNNKKNERKINRKRHVIVTGNPQEIGNESQMKLDRWKAKHKRRNQNEETPKKYNRKRKANNNKTRTTHD